MGRYIALDGTFNFRDIGGFLTADNKKVKEHVLYRSDALCKLSDHDLEQLNEMKIRTVVDFRAPWEAAKDPNRLPSGIRTVVLAPKAELAVQASASHNDDESKVKKMIERAKTPEGREYFKQNLDAMEEQMRQFVTEESGIRCYAGLLRLLLEPEAAPLIFHCRGGKDRTGWGAALILSVLGVPREIVIADYMATADYNQERNQRRMDEYRQYTDHPLVLEFLASLMQVKEIYIRAAFDEVDRLGGIDSYVRDILQLSEEEIKGLKKKYLED